MPAKQIPTSSKFNQGTVVALELDAAVQVDQSKDGLYVFNMTTKKNPERT